MDGDAEGAGIKFREDVELACVGVSCELLSMSIVCTDESWSDVVVEKRADVDEICSQ